MPNPLPLIAAAGLAVLGVTLTRRARAVLRPDPLQGDRRLAGAPGVITIRRDRWGTPHVRADSLAGALYGQGFVTAEDRLFQLDLSRRAATGTLAEVFGARAFAADQLLRAIGFLRSAEREWAKTSPADRALIEAYCDGLNAARAALPPPVETRLLRYRIRSFTPEEIVAFFKLMAWSLALNWDSELARLFLADVTDATTVQALDPALESPNGLGWTRPPLAAFALPGPAASNAFAIAGHRTATGAPLLASDPHLRSGLPPVFSFVHLTGGGLDVIGASIPGIPGVLIGHNRRIAWGLTIAVADTQDVFIERVDPDNPLRYLHDGQWKTMATYRERFVIRGAAPRDEVIRETTHGPVISHAFEGETRTLTLCGAPLHHWPGSALAAVRINGAADWDAFRAAVADLPYPTLNFVYADVDGHIGYQFGGRAPIRRSGVGALPAPGDGSADWIGWVPWEQTPFLFDPPNGQVVSANDRPPGDDQPGAPFFGFEWFEPYRARRLAALIGQSDRHTIDSIRRIQRDVVSAPMQTLATALLALRPRRALEAVALDALRHWDGAMRADSAAAAIVAVARRRILQEVVSPFGSRAHFRLGAPVHPAAAYTSYLWRNTATVLETVADWQARGEWETRGGAILAAACDELHERLGAPATWQWGRLHTLTLRHPLGVAPRLGRLLNRGPIPVGGDNDSVFKTSPDIGASDEAMSIPAMRMIMDVGDWDRSRAALPGGQSGNPLGPRYDDQLADWLAGVDHPLPFSDGAVERHTISRLTIRPVEPSR